MSHSDFPRAVARLSEGHCPLDNTRLQRTTGELQLATGDTEHREWGYCPSCDIIWELETVDGRPTITSNRPLTPDQIRKLYNRDEGQ